MNYQAPKDLLHNHVILVTGAGQGLGREAAIAYAAHGATVILLGRQVKKLEAVYDEILAAGLPEAIIYPMDFEKSTEDDCKALAEGIYQQLGRLDGILHSAVHFDNLSPLEIQTTAQFGTMFKVNVTIPFAITKACLPLLKRAPDASVLFTSSSAGHKASAYWGCHGVSKQAIEHLVKTWALELENTTRLRFNAIVPGPVQSPNRKKTHPGEVHASLAPASSLLPTYLYLMGKDSAHVSGQIIEA